MAVASGVGAFSVSTDGGGSARVPAAACGILGLKVTLGAIPHETWPFHFANNSSVAINSRHVEDLVLGFNLMAGASSMDPWSRRRIQPLTQPAQQQTMGPKKSALLISALGGQACDKKIMGIVQQSIQALQHNGYEITIAERDPVAFDPGLSLDMMAANLAARVRAMQPDEQAGLSALRSPRADVKPVQPDFNADAECPQAPLADPSQDQRVRINDDWAPLPAWWSHLSIANLTGHPAISIPCGWDADGLPVGLHAIAGWDCEQDLVDLAARVALNDDWTDHHARLS